MLPHDRYFVTYSGEEGEVEVTKEQYVVAERRAGFHNSMGMPNEPATSSFSACGKDCVPSGRIVYGRGL